ncbi:twin-arginine translocase subunit TatC [Humidesulfovibrio idahonensis]
MFGTGEMLIIALVAIIVVDPKKLPDLMKGLGKAIGEFKQMSGEFKRTIERETEAADFEKRKAEAHEKLYGEKAEGQGGAQPGTPDGPPDGTPGGTSSDKPAGEHAPEAERELQPEEYPQQPPVERAEPVKESAAGSAADGGLTPFDTTVEAPAVEAPAPEAAPATVASAVEAHAPEAEPAAEAPAEVPAETPAVVSADSPAAPLTAETANAPATSATPAAETPAEPADAHAVASVESTGEAAPAGEIPAAAAETPTDEAQSASTETPAAASGDVPAVAESILPAAPAESADDTAAPAVAQEAAAPAVSEPAEAPVPGGDTPPPPPPAGDDAVGEGFSGRMSLFGHLQDLRKRLTRSAIAMIIGFLGCYAFAGQMLKLLMQPMLNALKQSHFIYTLPTEAFFTEMKVAFVAGIFASSPYIFYQIFQFVAPGLYSHERRWIVPIAFFSALCFTVGALFGYFVVFPFGFEFFASYASDSLMFTPKLDEYLDFVLKLLFAFGIVFELPLFLFFLARLGIISHVGLRKKRKYAVLASFILAAALTPPDAVSQTMMAVPLCILYEVGIWLAYFFGKKKKPAPEEAAPEQTA